MRIRLSNVSPGRIYKFYTGQAVFEFGFGLSYTTFSYTWFRVNKHRYTMNGDDVVLAYIIPPKVLCDGEVRPIKQLFGFKRINLNVGEIKQVFFSIEY